MRDQFDAEQAATKISEWITEQVREAGLAGAVVGLSGGIDSATTAALCARALPGHTLGLIMPCYSDPQDVEDGRLVASELGIDSREVNLDTGYDALLSSLREAQGQAQTEDKLAAANLKPRLRMATLYYFANLNHYMVVGTGNRSELVTGYFTKYGDGGVDIEPLGNLSKQEVYEVARWLGIPQRIIDRPPSAGLWAGQTDESEMGVTYDDIEKYLDDREQLSPQARERIGVMERAAQHKLITPPLPPR